MAQVIETCRSCGSRELRWERDNGWITGAWRYLRCQRCGDAVRTAAPVALWALYAIAAGAVIWALAVVL